MRISMIEPSGHPISILSKKWGVEVIAALGGRTVRFNTLKLELDGISAKGLSTILKQMEEGKLVTRHHYPSIPPRVE